MTAIEETILALNEKLSGIPFDYVFLGGSVLSLLVTDPVADTVRVTKDVDVMMDIRSRKDYHKMETLLSALGFKHDTRDGAPICRWICEGTTVDVLPVRQDVLGWESEWFEDALAAAKPCKCGNHEVRAITAPYFVALKLEAFESRGEHDFLCSTDFEDVICLFNGRESIVDEIAACENLRKPLAEKFAEYLRCRDLDDAVEGFVQTEPNSSSRKAAILMKFAKTAKLV